MSAPTLEEVRSCMDTYTVRALVNMMASNSKVMDGEDITLRGKPHSSDTSINGSLAFEDIVESLGSFGHWQRVIFFLISAADVFGAMAMMLPVFTGQAPRWRCAQFEGENITMYDDVKSWERNVTTWGMCQQNGSKCLTFEYHATFTSIVGQWNLVCERAYLSDLISSVQMAGLFLGAAIFGQLSDLFGRKRSYYLAFVIEIGAGLLSAAAPNWQVYGLCRFAVGVGFGAYMVVNCVYPLEFVGKQWRLLCGTVGFWATGIMLLAGFGYLVREWRHLTVVTCGGGVLYLITWIWIPQSPRWLIQKGRFKEAKVILDTIACKNGRPPPDMVILEKFAEEDALERDAVKHYTYLDLFRQRRYMKRTLIMALSWFTVHLVYYEISFNLKNLSGDRYLNMFLGGFVDLGSLVIAILLFNRIGRRWSMALVSGVALAILLSVLGLILRGGTEGHAETILGLVLIGKAMSSTGGYNVQIFSAELFPTVVRNVGLGSGAMAGRLGGVLAPQLVYLGQVYRPAPYIVCSVLTAIVIPLYFLLPETNGRPLEDTYHTTGRHPDTSVTIGDEVAPI